jgi:ABC-type multidrug transport system permease subunit
MEFSAFGLVQVAAAVFLGNLLTLVVVKGFQALERDEPKGFFKWMAYAVPGLFALAALIGSAR